MWPSTAGVHHLSTDVHILRIQTHKWAHVEVTVLTQVFFLHQRNIFIVWVEQPGCAQLPFALREDLAHCSDGSDGHTGGRDPSLSAEGPGPRATSCQGSLSGGEAHSPHLPQGLGSELGLRHLRRPFETTGGCTQGVIGVGLEPGAREGNWGGLGIQRAESS